MIKIFFRRFKLGLPLFITFCSIVGIILGIIYIALINDILYWIIQSILTIGIIYLLGKAKDDK